MRRDEVPREAPDRRQPEAAELQDAAARARARAAMTALAETIVTYPNNNYRTAVGSVLGTAGFHGQDE
ncbi:MAG TPA: hypothetical protein VFV94_18570 [Polyangiaceae bacterium]|nr:hypothetical protein [Polyangiaceae bacterium]